MDLQFDESQRQLARAVAGFLKRHYDFAHRRDGLIRGDGDDGLWRRAVQDLALTGLTAPAAQGGHGGGAVEAMIVMEALGRRLALDAFAEHCIVASGLLRRASRADLLAAIVRGDARFALGFPEAGYGGAAAPPTAEQVDGGFRFDGLIEMVVGGASATHLLFRADCKGAPALFLLELIAENPVRSDYRTIDARSVSDFRFNGVHDAALLATEANALALLCCARIEGVNAVCAEAVGLIREMVDITIDFVRQRRQFGAPIGAFQVVQHRIVDMALALEQADAITLRAALAFEAVGERSAQIATAANIVVIGALRLVSQSAVQLHGAVGTAEETPISHYFRRATALAAKFGSEARNLEHYAITFAQAETD